MDISELAEGRERYCAECGRLTLHRFCKRCRRRRRAEGVGQAEPQRDDDEIHIQHDNDNIDSLIDDVLKNTRPKF